MKLRILIFFFKAGKSEVTVTGLAKTYGIGKYTVSRIISSLEADGLIDKTNPRSPALTEEGRAVAKHYSHRIDTVMRGLRLKGVALEQAQNDAFYMAMYLSDETYKAVRKMERLRRMKHGLEAMRQFSGDLLQKNSATAFTAFPTCFMTVTAPAVLLPRKKIHYLLTPARWKSGKPPARFIFGIIPCQQNAKFKRRNIFQTASIIYWKRSATLFNFRSASSGLKTQER